MTAPRTRTRWSAVLAALVVAACESNPCDIDPKSCIDDVVPTTPVTSTDPFASETSDVDDDNSVHRLQAVEVSCGLWFACGLFDDGSVVCWGLTDEWSRSPPSGGMVSIADSHEGWHMCGVDTRGNVVCWGDDAYGQSSPPPDIGSGVLAVATGGDVSCAIDAYRQLRCWGVSEDGVLDPPQGDFVDISIGGGTTACGITTNLDVACWGASTIPMPDAMVDIEVNNGAACGLDQAQAITCWGNLASIGNGDPIASDGRYDDLAMGGAQVCARPLAGLGLECWGQSTEGTPMSQEVDDFCLTHSGGCAVVNGSITCWGSGAGTEGPP